MALTRIQTPPAPNPADSAPLERESPRSTEGITPTPPSVAQETNGAAGEKPTVVTGEPTTRMGRLSKQLFGLGDDVKEIAELRIALAKAELTEQVDYGVGKAKQGSVAGVLAILGGFFLLVSLAIGLGWWLGHMFWGFLIVTGLLLLGAGIAWLVLKPKPPTLKKS